MHKERKAIYPGTFDPITNGHIDVVERASRLFDEIIVLLARNSRKTPLFSETERVEMAEEALARFDNVRVETFQGLMVDCARTSGATAVIRGLRAVSDFDYEFSIALMNRKLAPEIATVFLMPADKYVFLSSTIIREIARLGQDVHEFVPPAVEERLRAKFDLPPRD